MSDCQRQVIRLKNTAFHALSEAQLECDRRRHTSGSIPESWRQRLAALAEQYAEAVESFENTKQGYCVFLRFYAVIESDMSKENGRFEAENKAALKHGAAGYERDGSLPAAMQGFDLALADELLEHVGGDPAYRLLAQSAARRATLLELAYSWLAQPEIKVLWADNGVIKWQPILNRLGSWHEGLRRDLDALGLTPVARARLGVDRDRGAIDYEQLLEAQRRQEQEQ